jgi:Flp pilus assembly protein TadD
VQQNPCYVPALNALGIVYLMNDDPVAAATAHLWAAWLAPDNEIPHYNLSLSWQRLAQYDWAIAAAKRAAKLEPDNPHPLVALAIAQWSSGKKSAAEQSYRQVVQLDPRYSDSEFLNYLNEAGFSAAQIAISKQVLNAI